MSGSTGKQGDSGNETGNDFGYEGSRRMRETTEMRGKLVGVCRGSRRGSGKVNVGEGRLIERYGLEGDAHSGCRKEVSLAAMEDIRAINLREGIDAGPGDFAENLTVEGLDLSSIKVGDILRIGESIRMEVVQLGKKQEEMTSDFHFKGHTLLPRKGVFARIIQGGPVQVGDSVQIQVNNWEES